MIEANRGFLQKKTKKYTPVALSATKCYPYKARPSNLSAISPTSNVACMYAHMPVRTAEIWKKYRLYGFFYFLKAFLSLNRDKYFALFWCFCVRIPFILLLIKWSEMDLNVRPQTLVETFDQANSDSIPEYMSWALITLLTYPVSIHTAERSFSGLKRLQTLLRGSRQTRDCIIELSCNSAYEHRDVTDIDGIITEFACLKGTHLALCL